MRSAGLTLDGFVHDVCSAFHPLAVASPFFRTLPLADHGLEWAQPEIPLAHPLDGGRAVLMKRSVADTAAELGADGPAYRRLFEPLVDTADAVINDALGPLAIPRHPVASGRFGLRAIRSAQGLVRSLFTEARTGALFAGLGAHSLLPLDRSPSAGVALTLGLLAHTVGWPVPKGGSQRLADSLASYLRSLGGEIATGWAVESLEELPATDAVLLDLTPRQVLRIAGHRLPDRYRRALERYRYGVGVFKIDWALDGSVPWAAPGVDRAGTVHVGGTLAEIAEGEDAIFRHRHHNRPFVLLGQQGVADPTRAPEGRQAVWGYCHVPAASGVDMTEAIEAQVERFAPGFRDRILARHTMDATQVQRYNPNYVGGDINGGTQDLRQLFTRPAIRIDPYFTGADKLFICSSATPPGGGVHGLCGWYAARSALARQRGRGNLRQLVRMPAA